MYSDLTHRIYLTEKEVDEKSPTFYRVVGYIDEENVLIIDDDHNEYVYPSSLAAQDHNFCAYPNQIAPIGNYYE